MIKSTVAFTLSLFLVLLAAATPVTTPTAVHTQPDTNSSVIMVLSPGGSFVEDSTGTAPNGWTPIINEGPFEGYVLNKDIDKGLRVKLGAPIHMQPKSNSGVLTNMEDEDKASITGLHGKWTQISLDKSVTGYIQRQRATSTATISTPMLQDVPRQRSSNVAAKPAPDYGTAKTEPAATYRPAPATDSSGLPRLFEGRFVTTRRPFAPRRPYDWQLNDTSGVRYAYLDVTKLLLTERLESYDGRTVVVFGTPRATVNGKHLVIQIESLRLK